MKRLFFFLIIFAALLSVLSCGRQSWVMFRGSGGLGAVKETISPPVGIKWKLKLQEGDMRERHFNSPLVCGDTLYFGSPDGNFYALDLRSGFMKWVFKTLAPVNSVPYIDGEKIYFGSSDGYLYAADIKTGDPVWSFDTRCPVNSTITGYEGNIIFTSDMGNTHILSKEGEELYSVENPVWSYNSFQVNDSVVFFLPGPPWDPHSLGAYDLKKRDFLWSFPTGDGFASWYSFPAVAEGKVLFSSCADFEFFDLYTFYALDCKTGEVIWKNEEVSTDFSEGYAQERDLFRENIKLLDYMAPSVWKGNVVYIPGDNTIYCYRIKDGKLMWKKEYEAFFSCAPTVAGGRIYAGFKSDAVSEGKLVCIDAKAGNLLWTAEIEGEILGSPVITGGLIVFGTDRNYLYILEEIL